MQIDQACVVNTDNYYIISDNAFASIVERPRTARPEPGNSGLEPQKNGPTLPISISPT
ncbi:hypothetical protein GCM10027018_32220 [Paenibacillus thermoaerophilus]